MTTWVTRYMKPFDENGKRMTRQMFEILADHANRVRNDAAANSKSFFSITLFYMFYNY